MPESDDENDRPMPSPPGGPTTRDEEFVQLFTLNQHQIYIYLVSLVHDQNSADDIFQETMLVLWREFERFESGTNFMAWSCTVALNQVRAWRKKQQRDRLQFSDEFLDALSQELDSSADYLKKRYELLHDCIAKLPQHHRQLIAYRYSSGHAINEIAEQTQRSIDAVYRLLSRIRRSLQDCVTDQLILEDA
ncbi:ECF RNA polymerase sigma factor SigH [Bremerella volcania]|uniref:ECF RNA polymerase sigma factor SigH n=1 Tax=Bremerella volcania TaxID=2527984 RepID=A0A518C9P7_9BACT|nr:sigma-70 family RNA polymerase sigma factor [Bremerella volcania]QDU75949.1 ECF RNA polymerase sigma factor SigH [Bremerella volcania]